MSVKLLSERFEEKRTDNVSLKDSCDPIRDEISAIVNANKSVFSIASDWDLDRPLSKRTPKDADDCDNESLDGTESWISNNSKSDVSSSLHLNDQFKQFGISVLEEKLDSFRLKQTIKNDDVPSMHLCGKSTAPSLHQPSSNGSQPKSTAAMDDEKLSLFALFRWSLKTEENNDCQSIEAEKDAMQSKFTINSKRDNFCIQFKPINGGNIIHEDDHESFESNELDSSKEITLPTEDVPVSKREGDNIKNARCVTLTDQQKVYPIKECDEPFSDDSNDPQHTSRHARDGSFHGALTMSVLDSTRDDDFGCWYPKNIEQDEGDVDLLKNTKHSKKKFGPKKSKLKKLVDSSKSMAFRFPKIKHHNKPDSCGLTLLTCDSDSLNDLTPDLHEQFDMSTNVEWIYVADNAGNNSLSDDDDQSECSQLIPKAFSDTSSRASRPTKTNFSRTTFLQKKTKNIVKI